MSFPIGIVEGPRARRMVVTTSGRWLTSHGSITDNGFLIYELNQTKSNNHKSLIMKPITSNSSMISPDPLSHEQFQKPQSVDDDSMVLLPIYTYICRIIIIMFKNPLEATLLRIFQQVLTLLIHTWWYHEHSWVITCYHHDCSLFYCYIMANITLLVGGL